MLTATGREGHPVSTSGRRGGARAHSPGARRAHPTVDRRPERQDDVARRHGLAQGGRRHDVGQAGRGGPRARRHGGGARSRPRPARPRTGMPPSRAITARLASNPHATRIIPVTGTLQAAKPSSST